MRRAVLVLALLLAGCGGTVGRHARQHPADGRVLAADSMSVELPRGWMGRILIGAEGRPVLHAASFPLPSNDTDEGEVAKESMGIKGMYLNVRDLGPGESPVAFPITFMESDFGPPPPGPGSLCCHLREVSREVAVSGELYRITAISGGDESPRASELDELNGALTSLRIERYPTATFFAPRGKAISGFGLHAVLPEGWDGHVSRGLLEASDGSLTLRILEHGGTDAASFVTGRAPIQLGPAEFVPTQGGESGFETGRSFIQNGRDFVLWGRSQDNPPDATSLGQANAFLESFRVEPGDFYPGSVEPATFASADGWHTGTTGPAQQQPDGQQTMTWAATIPYRDSEFQLPPRATLEQLPPDGIVIDVQLFGPVNRHEGTATPPFRLEEANREYPWEGQVAEIPLYSIGGPVPGEPYEATIWVFFGRNHPSAEQLAAADEELARLDLPSWKLSRAAR